MRDLYAEEPLPYQHPRYERDGRGVEPGALDLWYTQNVDPGGEKDQSQPYATEGEALEKLMAGEDRKPKTDTYQQYKEKIVPASEPEPTRAEELSREIVKIKERRSEVVEALNAEEDPGLKEQIKTYIRLYDNHLAKLNYQLEFATEREVNGL